MKHFLLKITMVIALAVTSISLGAQCSSNILTNGSFESGSTGWSTSSANMSVNSGCYSQDGSNHVWLAPSSTVDGWMYQYNPATPGTTYTLDYFDGAHHVSGQHVWLVFYENGTQIDQVKRATTWDVDSGNCLLDDNTISLVAPANADQVAVWVQVVTDGLKVDGFCLTADEAFDCSTIEINQDSYVNDVWGGNTLHACVGDEIGMGLWYTNYMGWTFEFNTPSGEVITQSGANDADHLDIYGIGSDDFGLYTVNYTSPEGCTGSYTYNVIQECLDCTAVTVCTDGCSREVSNTTQCGNGSIYQMYLTDCYDASLHLTTTGPATWEECDNGSIHFTGQYAWGSDNITVDVTYFGGTTTPPVNSPKEHACDASYDPSGWMYYPEMCGTMTSSEHGTFDLSPNGPSFQVGYGANVTSTGLGFGASGWLTVSGGDGHYLSGDFNLMLSEATDCGVGTVSGHVFSDVNGDGIQQAGETDLAGVDLLITAADGSTQTVTTDSNGNWTATVVPGSTTVDIVDATLPAGVEQTSGTDVNTVIAVSGSDTFTDNDGFYLPGSLSGRVYYDINGDGVYDSANEPVIPNLEILVTDSNGNTFTIVTNSNGVYSTPVPPGSTTVKLNESDSDYPAGYIQTDGNDPTTNTVVAGDNKWFGRDGFYTPGSVSGHLYIDTNGNGTQDAGEPDLAGVDVEVTDSNGATQIVQTDANGDWEATVPPGSTVADILEGDPEYPDGYTQIEGSDPTTVTAVGGQDVFTDNDGFYQSGTVSGHLFIDTNGNGVQEAGEINLVGVDVIITDVLDVQQTVTSDANGDWVATVPPGSTSADVDESDADFPADHVQTSGSDPTTVTAVAGTDTFTDNDGYYQAAEVFGHIYIDTNKNSTQDTGEPNVANLDVVIMDSNDNTQTVTTNAAGDWVAIVPPGTVTADIDENDPQYPTGLSQSEGEDPTQSFAIAGESVDGGTDGFADCPEAPSANIEFQQYLCEGESVVYEVENPLAFATYMWNFGPAAEPSTYSGTGPIEVFYNTPITAGADVLLIVEAENCPAKSSIVAIARVTPILDETTIETDAQVCADLTKTFEAGNVSPLGIYEWDFGPGATPSTAFGAGPHDVVFADGGAQEVTLTSTPDYQDPFKVCSDVKTYTFEAEDCFGTISGNVSDIAGAALEGVSLTLDDSDPLTTDLTTTTDANGDYEFLYAPVGEYTIVETQPANYGSVSDEDATPEDPIMGDNDGVVNNEIPVKLNSDEIDADNNFVEQADLGTVSGNVSDSEGNPIASVILTLVDGDAGTSDPITATNADGDYSFANVEQGTYTVEQAQPANYTSVSDEDATPEDPSIGDNDGIVNDAIPVKVTPGEDDADNDFVESPDAGTVSGTVLDDAGNPIVGVVLTLVDGDAATIDLTETTNAVGAYEFTEVPVGTYTIVETQPADYTSVSDEDTSPEDPSIADNDGLINDAIPVKVTPGEDDEDNDFVESPDQGSVSGKVEDSAGNPIAGVLLTLEDGDAATTDMTTVTLPNGTYEFSNVPVGTYTIVETQPAEYASVSDEDATPEDPSVGDADGITDNAIPVKVEAGEDDEDNDFIENLTAIYGHVYFDTNSNGVQDLGEPNIPNVTVTITKSDASTAIVETDANGDWMSSTTAGLTEAIVDESDADFIAVVGSEYQQTEGSNPNVTAVPAGSLTNGGNDGYSGVPDITPVITFFPTNVTGVSDMFFTIKTQELIETPTNGLITLIFPKDARLTFDYSQELTSSPIGPLDNPDWTYNGENESFHIWTTESTVEALGSSTLGFFAQYDPQMSTGEVTFTVTIITGSGSENNFLNNIDAETLDYFSGGQN